MDQCRFPRTGNAGNAHEHLERELYRHVLQIVFPRTYDLDLFLAGLTAFLRDLDLRITTQILCRERRLVL